MKKFNIVLIILLCIALAGLLFLRWRARETPAAPVIAETAPPQPLPTVTPEPTPTPAPMPTPSLVPTPEPTVFVPPQGYTEESYNLVSDMVYAYADRQEAAVDIIRADLEKLNTLDPALGAFWTKLMRVWSEVNSGLTVNPGVLPDGLPEDESLCIVVLGFQLESDGSMAPELLGRCETALRCAEKYPNALIAVTGGGTAWSNPNATEAGVMADWLMAHGVEASRILKEDASRTTGDNAEFTVRLLVENHPEVKALAIVSSDYHVPLGVLLFQEEALLHEYETGTLPFSVISNAAYDTGGYIRPDSPMMQKMWLWGLADPHY
jgi:uncharacterized SAM-binding protein YcdF (DUF218 family)